MTLPLYMAWVDATDTDWSDSFARLDEQIFSGRMVHAEGDFPVLEIEIKNPYVGLLSPGRKVYAWFARDNNGTAEPFLFGRLVTLPDDLFAEVVKLKFMARDPQWELLKQAAAESLKILPNYDPLCVDTNKRDDPDTVLLGYSELFHYDRVPSGSQLSVTTSDIVQGEDGTVFFDGSTVPYDSLKLSIKQQPLTRLRVRGSTSWTQRAGGQLSTSIKTTCLTGGSLVNDWPKAGTNLGAGWTVASAHAFGGGAQFGSPINKTFNWQNKQKDHFTGDTMSIDVNWTVFPAPVAFEFRSDYFAQVGLVSETLSDTLGGPPGVNHPAITRYTQQVVVEWDVSAYMVLDYEAVRPRTEYVEFTVHANLQPILTDPDEPASLDTEQLDIQGGDASNPILPVFSWYSLFVTGQTVARGTVVYSTPEFPGPTLYAICVGEGAVGATEPSWSDILGTTLADDTVTWAALGQGSASSANSNIPVWKDVANSVVTAGTIIAAQFYSPAILDWGGVQRVSPPGGVQSYQIAVQGGTTEAYSTSLFTGIADLDPGHPEPHFSSTPGGLTTDGTVVWACLDVDVPVGLMTQQRTYFNRPRGNQTIEYMLARARARLRMRARCFEVSFQCPWYEVLQLSCRKNVLLYDRRLPGGQILGKVTSYGFTLSGDTTEFVGEVTIAATAGFGDVITPDAGTPVYVADGYVDPGYQIYSGAVVLLDDTLGYTPPTDAPDDDGLVFPLTKDTAFVKEAVLTGSTSPAGPTQTFTYAQRLPLPLSTAALESSQTTIEIPNGFTVALFSQTHNPRTFSDPPSYTVQTPHFFPITQYYAELKPMQGVSFTGEYIITTTDLTVPKMIDLEAS